MAWERFKWSVSSVFMLVAIVVTISSKPSLAAGDIGSVMAPAGSDRAAGWTGERMQRAKPRQIPNVDPASVKGQLMQTGPATETPASSAENGERAGGNLYKLPLFWVGKLFYTTPDGDYQCTAQFISPQVILTAAQCVRDSKTGEFYTDFVFALQYRDGKYTKTFSYKCAAANNGWVQPGLERYAYDYATILLDAELTDGVFRHAP